MKKLVAAIDSSAAATPVLATAAALAQLYPARLEVLHVGDDHEGKARSLAHAAGVELHKLEGPAAEQLLAIASDPDVLAMVVGARGLPLGRRPVGSTALALITEIEKPLIVVPPETRTFHVNRLLVPLDGARESSDAMASTIELACAHDVEVVILHVQHGSSVPRFSDAPQYDTETFSTEFLARNCPCAHVTDLKLRAGLPGENVLEVAHAVGANMIALAWSQVLSPDRAAVVRTVLERSTVPVLLVPVAA